MPTREELSRQNASCLRRSVVWADRFERRGKFHGRLFQPRENRLLLELVLRVGLVVPVPLKD